MGDWNFIVIICCAALLFFMCRKEWLRRNKARLIWRIAASIIAVVCLACIALPLTFTETNIASRKGLIVITDGANRDSVRSFKKNLAQNAGIVEKDEFLSMQKNKYDSVHVFGYGFTEDELLLLNEQKIIFHPANIKTGITSIEWNRQPKKGEDLWIQGTYTNETESRVTLLLSGFNTVVDSVVILSKQTQSFQLHTVPKQNGKGLFTIVALQGKDTLEKEPVPVEVLPSAQLKVMILASSPDFENRFLKDWLSQNGYAVAARTSISAKKFDKAIVNSNTPSLDHLTPALLDSFDIVISDETSLTALALSEQEAVHRQVTTKGMGLVIRGDTISAAREWFTKPFHLFQLAGKQPSQITYTFTEGENRKAVLPGGQPTFIRLQNGMQALVADSLSNAAVAVMAEGAGKMVFSTLNNTYSLLLSGNTTQYYSLWNLLLQKAGRQNKVPGGFETVPALPALNHPVTLQVEIMSDTFPAVKTGQSQPAFAQDLSIPYRWQTTWWPVLEGWQEPVVLKGQAYNWYVYGQNDWSYITALQKKQSTATYAAKQAGKPGIQTGGGDGEEKPVSLFLFLLPFIICSGFLWLERKIS